MLFNSIEKEKNSFLKIYLLSEIMRTIIDEKFIRIINVFKSNKDRFGIG